MTHDTKNEQDRGIWERYRRTWPDSIRAKSDIDPTGEDANQISAFLTNRLSRRDQSAFIARMAHEPALREAVIAARMADVAGAEDAPETEAPAELTAWARNLRPLHNGRRKTAGATARTRGDVLGVRGFFKPVSGFAFGMALLGIVAGYGIYRAVDSGTSPPAPVAKSKDKSDTRRAGDKDRLDPDKNSIFSADPDWIFDGLDVNPD